jgi:UDP-2-acetamido-3-amino-2,3-dideoxy-glucuronate N-acetyltransferase
MAGPLISENAAIAADVKLGKDVRIAPFVNLYGCSIGDETTVGSFVEVQRDASVGRRCKISSHTFICSGVEIEDEVFVGHGVVFINDRHPSATNSDGSRKGDGDWTMERTFIRRRAAIGSGAVIMCGIDIGEGALVAAGALVTHDVPPGGVVKGDPARVSALKNAPGR